MKISTMFFPAIGLVGALSAGYWLKSVWPTEDVPFRIAYSCIIAGIFLFSAREIMARSGSDENE